MICIGSEHVSSYLRSVMITEFYLVTMFNDKRRATGRSLLAPCRKNYGYPRFSQFLATAAYQELAAEARAHSEAIQSTTSATHQVDIRMEDTDDEPTIVEKLEESDADAIAVNPKPSESSIKSNDRNAK